jgi:hypothetical protein
MSQPPLDAAAREDIDPTDADALERWAGRPTGSRSTDELAIDLAWRALPSRRMAAISWCGVGSGDAVVQT